LEHKNALAELIAIIGGGARMPTLKELPYFIISAEAIADWLDRQPDIWWYVDGDPKLTSKVDFPAPADELSGALRRFRHRQLQVFDGRPQSSADGRPISSNEFDQLADLNNRHHERTFLLRWDEDDGGPPWLLIEDKSSSEDAKR
jgi:hypothetical protein